MAKSVLKSVRLTPEVLAFIEGYQGDSFTQKLENMVIDMMVTEKRLKKRFSDLNMQIEERQKLFDTLSKEYEVFSRVRRDATYLEKQFAELRKRIESSIVSETGKDPPD